MTLLIVIPTTLLLVTITDFGKLVVLTMCVPNESDVGESTGAESVPAPCSAIIAGLFEALLVMVRLPVRVPCAVGLKVTPTVHEAGGGVGPVDPAGPRMVAPDRLQGLVPIFCVPKSPDTAMLLTVIATALGFVSVAVLTVALVVPTRVLGNKMLGERLINPARPVPLSATVCGLLEAFEGMFSVPLNVATAVAVKVTPTVHVAVGSSVMLEHVSDDIWKFGEGPSTPVVIVVIWPKVSVPADRSLFCTVTNLGGVVVPEFI